MAIDTTEKRKARIARDERQLHVGEITDAALSLLETMYHDDPKYLAAAAAFHRVLERADRNVAGDIEEAANLRLYAAAEAMARAWLRDRGSAPLTMPGRGEHLRWGLAIGDQLDMIAHDLEDVAAAAREGYEGKDDDDGDE